MLNDILVFDDSIDLLDAFDAIFSRNGYKVPLAKNKLIFEEKLREKKPDLILLDVMLAGMDGRELCKELKDDNKTKNIPILLISASPKLLADSECADGTLEKPFKVKELISKVELYLSRQQ